MGARSAVGLAFVLVAPVAGAATYVDEPPLGRFTARVELSAAGRVETPASVVSVRTSVGHQWDSGLALHVFGGAGTWLGAPVAFALEGGEVRAREWSSGLALRWGTSGDGPFVEASAAALRVQLRGDVVGDVDGALLGGKVGGRLRREGWELVFAVQGERALLGHERVPTRRYGLVVGVGFDL